jgi:Holliday junction resolvase RusA-like endonuclease
MFGLEPLRKRKCKVRQEARLRRRRDIDNLLKCTLDSLEHARVFADDSQVDELYIERGEVTPGGALAIEIQSVST